MTSSPSAAQQPDASTPESFTLTVQAPLPSLNRLLALGHWQRARLKRSIQESVLSALRATESDSSMRIICARSTTATASATLACYLEMIQAKRASKRASKKSRTSTKSGPK